MRTDIRRWIERLSSERILAATAAVLALSLSLVAWAWAREARTVYYIPSADRAGVHDARAGRIPPSHVARFAESFVRHYESWTPATVESHMDYAARLCSPRLLAASRDPEHPSDPQRTVFSHLIDYSRHSEAAWQVELFPDETLVEEDREGWRVSMVGIKTEYVHGTVYRLARVRYSVYVIPGVVSRATPDGLWMEDFRPEAVPLDPRTGEELR